MSNSSYYVLFCFFQGSLKLRRSAKTFRMFKMSIKTSEIFLPCLVFTPSKGIIHLSMDVIWRGGHKGSFYTTTSIPRNFANISRELLRSEITTISPLRHTVTNPQFASKKSTLKIINFFFLKFYSMKNPSNWLLK